MDGGGSLEAALLGAHMARLAMAQGWAGLIIHGAVRDAEELETLDIAIWALGTCPARGGSAGTGEVDGVLDFGRTGFAPGGWVTADADGVVVLETPPRP
ncbi:RraA family protein [Xylophilus rhododendri]|uniref:RraA family protein n=1 Tax=Xylophilus rhododendri TaxID=2697032 RepID=UPI001E312978|nr:hypothetical protein [Xylophilus rhododendri]